MKIFGIICEYNPFHNGHLRQLDFCRKSGADLIFCAMSGDFTQRGEPAVLDKRTRARHAVLCGADIVVELPVVYAVSSAENFALAGVRLLNEMGCTHLCFGSECGDVKTLARQAEVTCSKDFDKALKYHLANGNSYPRSAFLAAGVDSVLNSPNNLLGIEYLKALKTTGSAMIPITVRRDSDFNSQSLLSASPTASASAIRNNLHSEMLREFVPQHVFCDLVAAGKNLNAVYEEYAHKYLSVCTVEYLKDIEGVSEGLENRIFSAVEERDFDSFLSELKTKRYTLPRLKRIIFNALLGITATLATHAKGLVPSYLPLAAKADGKGLRFIAERHFDDKNEHKVTVEIDKKNQTAERLFCALSGIRFSKIKKLKKF